MEYLLLLGQLLHPLDLQEAKLVRPEVLKVALLALLAPLARHELGCECAVFDFITRLLFSQPLDFEFFLLVESGRPCLHAAGLGPGKLTQHRCLLVRDQVVFSCLVLMQRHRNDGFIEVFDLLGVRADMFARRDRNFIWSDGLIGALITLLVCHYLF